jgi:F0F1-type ATP synthase epsilon subunit
MSRVMTVWVCTPAGPMILPGIRRLRLEATDGARGVLPGHERARLTFVAGPIELVEGPDDAERILYLATEGGVAQLEPSMITLVCRWAAQASSLPALREHVRARRAERAAVEQEARMVAHRHEIATRRALAGLRREVLE